MMSTPRTEATKRLEPFQRQFHQWRYKDGYSQKQVKILFDILFMYLYQYDGIERHATSVSTLRLFKAVDIFAYNFRLCSDNQWTSRRLEWNKRWKMTEGMKDQSLDTTSDSRKFPIWFEGTEFAAEFQPVETGNGESYVDDVFIGRNR